MPFAKAQLPENADIPWLAQRINAITHAQEPDADGEWLFCADDLESAFAVIGDYDALHLEEQEKPAKLAQIVDARSERVRTFSHGPLQLTLDDKTEARITGATVFLMRNADRTHVNWDVGGANFVRIPREQMLGLGDAVGSYVQACFDHSEVLAEQARAVSTSEELAAVDIGAGWPE